MTIPLEQEPNRIAGAGAETGQSRLDAYIRAKHAALRAEIRESEEKTRRLAFELHEEVMAQLTLLEEHLRAQGARRKDP